MTEKEIRFNPKRVDESWKENVASERGKTGPHASERPVLKNASGADAPASSGTPEKGIGFLLFIQSLAMQALIQLGLVPAPNGEESEVNLEAAQELIDILVMLKEKTAGNLSPEEEKLITSAISDLQLKFVSVRAPHEGRG